MDVAAVSRRKPIASDLLLEHCFALEADRRPPTARDRLEALLGSELSRRLVDALSRAR
jgi:hypothetical protein